MATGRGDTALCQLVKVDIERLPDLNVPRSGHIALCVGKQMVVMGGHTKGFVLTPTAEYYEDGAWHLVPMTYDHDCGTAVLMSSGKVMIAGGMEKNLGIGQTYPVEIYDPETHSFEGMGCLYKKRALASAVEIAGGRVIIVGNWYKEDCVEVFDGDENFDSLAPVTTARAYPYILRTADNDAIVLTTREVSFTMASSMASMVRPCTCLCSTNGHCWNLGNAVRAIRALLVTLPRANMPISCRRMTEKVNWHSSMCAARSFHFCQRYVPCPCARLGRLLLGHHVWLPTDRLGAPTSSEPARATASMCWR